MRTWLAGDEAIGFAFGCGGCVADEAWQTCDSWLETSTHGYCGDVETKKSRFGPELQSDQKLYRAKLVAGMISVLALVAMFITSLYRAPNPVWSVIVGVIALGLAVAIGIGVARRCRR